MTLKLLESLGLLRELLYAFYLKEIEGNQRIQRMLWAIAFLIIIYLSFLVSDQVDVAKSKALGMKRAHASLARQEDMSAWQTRLNAETNLNLKLRKRLWIANSPGLASADYQTELQRFISLYEMRQWTLTLADPVVLENLDGWLIQADIIGKISRDDIPKLIFEMEEEAKFIQIVRFSYNTKSEVLRMLVSSRFSNEGER